MTTYCTDISRKGETVEKKVDQWLLEPGVVMGTDYKWEEENFWG